MAYKSQPSNNNKHHHHGGAICYYSGMVMANQSTPPKGASAEGVGRGRCSRVLLYVIIWLRKKIFSVDSNIV